LRHPASNHSSRCVYDEVYMSRWEYGLGRRHQDRSRPVEAQLIAYVESDLRGITSVLSERK